MTPHSFTGGFVITQLSGHADHIRQIHHQYDRRHLFCCGHVDPHAGRRRCGRDLKVGDLVLTASGEMRAVKWMGHVDIDFRRTPRGGPGLPIRIAADAFGPARPSQDLSLSAGHSVCVDLLGEVLIPVGYLVNGGTIAETDTDAISYWHVELESHDILIANNLPAESYLAMTNRGAFEELRGVLPARSRAARGRTPISAGL